VSLKNLLTESAFSKSSSSLVKAVYAVVGGGFIVYSTLVLVGPLLSPSCDLPRDRHGYLNVEYDAHYDPCRWRRLRVLGGLNDFEAEQFRRIIVAAVCGSVFGIERASTRAVNAALMTRLMTIVALCGCLITIASMLSALSGPMKYDASRATAQVPKGVGFLCGAVTWVSHSAHEVRGATTSVTVWAAAAIGTMVGGGLYMPAIFATLVSVTLMYFGQQLRDAIDAGSPAWEGAEEESSVLKELARPLLASATLPRAILVTTADAEDDAPSPPRPPPIRTLYTDSILADSRNALPRF